MSASWNRVSMLLILAVVAGCHRSEVAQPIDSAPETSEASQPEMAKTNSVLPDVNPSTSPAAAAEVLFDQTPEGVCGKFMEMLSAGDRIGAQNLLTRTSSANIAKAGLKLEPMGGPHASIVVSDVQYATNRQKLALVHCQIQDPEDPSSEMKIAWQVKKQGMAWRISGVVLEVDPESAPDLLSFENTVDVAQLQSVASQDVLDEEPTRQADASPDDVVK